MYKDNSRIVFTKDHQEACVSCVVSKQSLEVMYGCVYDTFHRCLPHVTIKLVDHALQPIKHTISGNDGCFMMTGNPASHYLLLAKEGYQLLFVSCVTTKQAMSFTLVKEAVYACDVIGRCKVNQQCLPQDMIAILDETLVRVNPCGNFAFTHVKPGMHTLHIHGETCESYHKKIEIYKGESFLDLGCIALVYKQIGCTLHGVISDELGKGINHALVLLCCSYCDQCIKQTHTNSEGIYFFGNLKQGSYYIKAVY